MTIALLLSCLSLWLAACGGDLSRMEDRTTGTLVATVAASAMATEPQPTQTATETPVPASATPASTVTPSSTPAPTAQPSPTPPPFSRGPFLVGRSVEGRPIESYTFGHGPQTVIAVGGIHGGYEWNTILLAYETIDYFQANPDQLPAGVTLIVIPNANPDGLHAVSSREGRFVSGDLLPDTLPGRFNARGVDLNRNWDCQWTAEAFWRNQTISGGTAPFSEPETRALRYFFLQQRPAVVIFWHSAAEGVFASGCQETGPRSLALTAIYGQASGYPIHPGFDLYPVTGDAGDWLTTQGIPAFAVELTTHEDLEWERNRAGLLAILAHLHAQSEPSPTAVP